MEAIKWEQGLFSVKYLSAGSPGRARAVEEALTAHGSRDSYCTHSKMSEFSASLWHPVVHR